MKLLLKFSAILLMLGFVDPALAHGHEDPETASSKTKTNDSGRFEAPIEILADGNPIKGTGYPSPTLYDLDKDGKHELVVGDIMGNIFFAKRSSENSVHKWGKTEKLQAEGKAIKLNNW